MKRWGEICRVNYDNKLYILSSSKYQNLDIHSAELYRTWFVLEISTKTAKKNRDKSLSKEDAKYSLLNSKKNPIRLAKELLFNLKTYLDTYKPESLAIGAHGNIWSREKARRFKLYNSIFTNLSYSEGETIKLDRDKIVIYHRNDN